MIPQLTRYSVLLVSHLWKQKVKHRPMPAAGGGRFDDEDDFFAETRMSFGDHLEELRKHLMKAIYGFMIAMCVGVYFGRDLVMFIARPVEAQLLEFHQKRIAEAERKLLEEDPILMAANAKKQPLELEIDPRELARFGIPVREGMPPLILTVQIRPVSLGLITARVEQLVGRPPTLATLTIMEGFMVWMKVSMYAGVVLASPWIFYQLWSFIAAGLYPHEKKLVNVYLPVSLFLFLLGVGMCEAVVLPMAVKYLLSFNEWMGLTPELRLNDWLSFAIVTPLMFGIAFQLPMIMLFLERLGVVDVPFYRRHRRVALFGLCLVTVVLTPSADPATFLSLMLPLWTLYEGGILLCRWWPRPKPEVTEGEAVV